MSVTIQALQLASLLAQAVVMVLAIAGAARSTHGTFWRLLAGAFGVGAARRALGVATALGMGAPPPIVDALFNVGHSLLALLAVWPVLRDRLKLDRVNDDVRLPTETMRLQATCGVRLSEPVARLIMAARRLGGAKHGQ